MGLGLWQRVAPIHLHLYGQDVGSVASLQNTRGREGGKEGGREEGRECARVGEEKERGREGGRGEGGRVRGWEGGRGEGEREGGKEGGEGRGRERLYLTDCTWTHGEERKQHFCLHHAVK